MNTPEVSVILPVFNSDPFLSIAIQSVLNQTFPDFELIIINDGSGDLSEQIILSFTDPRIIYLKNKENKGLIFSLNRGIEIAQGIYIARMDADDICIKERFAKQIDFLKNNNDTAVIASTVVFINESGAETGGWPLDRITITAKNIRKKMPFENCIAHPSVLMKANVIKELKYHSNQKNVEDYHLWLRILNRGHEIAKINEPLLYYRRHESSVTSVHLKKLNPFFKHFRMKVNFILNEFFTGHISFFYFKVIFSALLDLFKGSGKMIKNIFK